MNGIDLALLGVSSFLFGSVIGAALCWLGVRWTDRRREAMAVAAAEKIMAPLLAQSRRAFIGSLTAAHMYRCRRCGAEFKCATAGQTITIVCGGSESISDLIESPDANFLRSIGVQP